MANKPVASVDEIISALNHSSLRTVIVEGDSDLIVLRKLEEEYADLNVSVMPIGGRENVISLYRRRAELKNLDSVFFLADRDMWVMTGTPEEFDAERLMLTSGYSIENEVYVDGRLEDLLNGDERGRFQRDRDSFLRWYALASSRAIAGRPSQIALHPDHVLNDPVRYEDLCATMPGEEYPEELRFRLQNEYPRLLRGRSLIQLLLRSLSYPGRPVRHNHASLMELVGARRGALIRRIFDGVGQQFGR